LLPAVAGQQRAGGLLEAVAILSAPPDALVFAQGSSFAHGEHLLR